MFNWKKVNLLVLFSLLFLFTACSSSIDKSSISTNSSSPEVITESSEGVVVNDGVTLKGEDDEKLKEFLEYADSLESPLREYGREQIINVNAGSFLAHISYPEGGLGQLDDTCENWAKEILNIYEEISKYDDGELIVTYNSYIIDNKYVVVEFTGEYNNQYYANAEAVIATFNADIMTGEVLNINEVLNQEQIERLTKHVMFKNSLDFRLIDNELLNKWQCAEGGIKVTLPPGKYLPAAEGSKTVFASYDYLDGLVGSNSPVNELSTQQSSSVAISSISETESSLTESSATTINEEITTSSSDLVVESETTSSDLSNPEAKYIALSFDDGPGDDTARLLDILKENDVHVSFFVLGSRIDSNPELLSRMALEGHEVAGHSWTHKSFTSLNNQQVKAEIMQTRAKIYELTGVDSLAVRPPYGAFNDRVRAVARELGVYFVNWNVDPVDWKTRSAQKTYDAIINTAANGNIVLCHDIHSSTVDSMALVIPKLLSEGYQFVTVKELLGMGFGTPEAGTVYYSMDRAN